ncbi:hypothetical protein [Hyphomonas adhaerens]|nr:hypothetical protein [Hyphomonas adhaerens]
MDDLIVDTSVDGETRRLSLQVKRSVTISDAESNTDFREIIAGAKDTRAKADFLKGRDRYGFVARTVGDGRFQSLNRIIDWARASDSASHFAARFEPNAEANQTDILVRRQICNLLTPASVEEERAFFSDFVALQLDGFEVNAPRYTEYCNRLSDIVSDRSEGGAALGAILCRLVREGEGKAKVWTRPSLLFDLRSIIKLNTAPAFASDISILHGMSIAACQDITMDIDGVTLDRSDLVVAVNEASGSFRFTNIRGLPGAGKSVILRRIVDLASKEGPVLLLKSDRLEGASWVSHANAIGLRTSDPHELLAQIGAVGTPVLFIDGIDRIPPDRRGVIKDLMQAIECDPALDHWRVIATSRDQGLEAYRNWVPVTFYKSTGIGDVHVEGLNDEESKQLAEAIPSLRPLLFGSEGVKLIARRPFFASVLAKRKGDDELDPPTTETALIDAWWKAGGYNAEPHHVLARQRALLECAVKGASALGKSIRLRYLEGSAQVALPGLLQDDVFQSLEDGVEISFAHDIYFEWAFYKLLIDAGEDWINVLKAAGEPPLLGRIVGLYSQREFERSENWSANFLALNESSLRPQWRRAWMLGPTYSVTFTEKITQFEVLLFGQNFEWLGRFLTWFQAEGTIPNPIVLKLPPTTLDSAALIRAADYLGWPSDVAAWRRVLDWLLAQIDQLPASVLPSVASLFAVWQNMFSDLKNPISQQILNCVQNWLDELQSVRRPDDPTRNRWKDLEQDVYAQFVSSLRNLILRSARAFPEFATGVVENYPANQRNGDEQFIEIAAFSPILVETCPDAIADMVRRALMEELPQQKIDRERRESETHYAHLRAIREKPEGERTEHEKKILSFPRSIESSREYDFDDIGIEKHHRAFFPSTPLDQPFAALLEKAPEKGLKLICDLSNHATEGWRQIHSINSPKYGTPLPLTIYWPWGQQTFYGDGRTYTWYLGSLPPQPLQSAFLALTHWAHQSIDAGRSVDEVIKDVVCGHESWTVLGLAISLALEKAHVSETVLSLLRNPRLWAIDISRQVQAPIQKFTLPGLDPRNRMSPLQRDGQSYLQERAFHNRSLRDLTPLFVLNSNQELSSAAQRAISSFPDELPFDYEEERSDRSREEYLRNLAKSWAATGDPSNYIAEEAAGREGAVAIRYQASQPLPDDLQATLAHSEAALLDHQALHWAMKGLETGKIDANIDADAVLAHIRSRAPDISLGEVEEAGIGIPQSALVACAALATRHFSAHHDWAWDVLARVDNMKEESTGFYSSPNRYHPKQFLIAALCFDLQAKSNRPDSASRLLTLSADDNSEISKSALIALGSLYPYNPALAWTGAFIATSLFSLPIGDYGEDGRRDRSQQFAYRTSTLASALKAFNEDLALSLVPPPPAWVFEIPPRRREWEPTPTEPEWRRPNIEFNHSLAAAVLRHFPFEDWLHDAGKKEQVTEYLCQLVTWSKERAFPEWEEEASRRSATELYEWYRALADLCVRATPALTSDFVIEKLLLPIIAKPDEDALSFAADFVSSTACRLVMDAANVENDAMKILSVCLDRLLQENCFKRSSYRAGRIGGLVMPGMIRDLMFVEVKDASGAMRFANGDWSELDLVLPIVDRLMKEGGWSEFVMDTYLTLCQRAGPKLRIADFTRHVLPHLCDGRSYLRPGQGSLIPARIAGVIQALADANYPLNESDAQSLLWMLDNLVDMGDRRAAALQQSSHFREIQFQSPAPASTD